MANAIGEPVDNILETLLDLFPKTVDTISPSKGHLISGRKKPFPPPPEEELVKRPPIVTIMGHVDHGKTTLLDCLRNSRIVESEFGGITQHIKAFTLNDGANSITFLDTPGHLAFAQMRERGANSTDIIVLVVAADDGVKEQTVQSIKYAKESGVPIIVAINKCDKPTAKPEEAKRSLLPYDVVVEDFHGNALCVEISALYGTNIGALKDAILLQAEELNLRSSPKGRVEGIVIESTFFCFCFTVRYTFLHQQHFLGLGKECVMIVQRGTLKKGCYLVGGTSFVRSLMDESGREVKGAGPSTPVRVLGWKDLLPSPGERVYEVLNERQGTNIVSYRKKKNMEKKADEDWALIKEKRMEERAIYMSNRQKLLDKGIRVGSTLRAVVHKVYSSKSVLPNFFKSIPDVDGTLEAILNVLHTYSSVKVKLQIVTAEVGTPADLDIKLASEMNAVIYCFNVTSSPAVEGAAERLGVTIEKFNVIYHLVESLKDRLSEQVPMELETQIVGEGQVIKEFLVSYGGKKRRSVAGVLVRWGTFKRNCTFRFLRAGGVYYEGKAESLQCENQVKMNVCTGREVGIAMEDKTLRYKEDDAVVALEDVPVKKAIDWNPPGF
ncbi:unnamed protein product [Enterobius vermicularis]|uniref:Tr-type G domain-containing protein n=1 Tax=Enterobius vermicularis TaxID=51028 RepID=A0A0N4UVY5_ENTVE|nr:unnamed protein product [Enterobius vermicularis]